MLSFSACFHFLLGSILGTLHLKEIICFFINRIIKDHKYVSVYGRDDVLIMYPKIERKHLAGSLSTAEEKQHVFNGWLNRRYLN